MFTSILSPNTTEIIQSKNLSNPEKDRKLLPILRNSGDFLEDVKGCRQTDRKLPTGLITPALLGVGGILAHWLS